MPGTPFSARTYLRLWYAYRNWPRCVAAWLEWWVVVHTPARVFRTVFSYQTKHKITCHLKTGIFINAPVIIYQYLKNYALAKNDMPYMSIIKCNRTNKNIWYYAINTFVVGQGVFSGVQHCLRQKHKMQKLHYTWITYGGRPHKSNVDTS